VELAILVTLELVPRAVYLYVPRNVKMEEIALRLILALAKLAILANNAKIALLVQLERVLEQLVELRLEIPLLRALQLETVI
jgi:hypothetical protein